MTRSLHAITRTPAPPRGGAVRAGHPSGTPAGTRLLSPRSASAVLVQPRRGLKESGTAGVPHASALAGLASGCGRQRCGPLRRLRSAPPSPDARQPMAGAGPARQKPGRAAEGRASSVWRTSYGIGEASR